MALTPEQLAAIQAAMYAPVNSGEGSSSASGPRQILFNGYNYAPQVDAYGNVTGYRAFQDDPSANNHPSAYNGRDYTDYNLSGQQTDTGTLSGFKDGSFMSDWGPFLATAALMAPAAIPSLGAAMSFGANPVLAAEGAGAVGAGSTLAGGAGSMAGDLVDPSLGGAGGSMGGGLTTAGGTGGGALETFGAFPQVSVPAASTFPEISTLGSGLPSWMSAAAPWLKVAAPILGAIAGSKGVKTNSTQTSNINPQVAPYVYGNGSGGGLLGGVQGLLQQQTSPQAQQGWQQVQQAALGLLNGPVAGNGFSRFFPGK